MMSSSLYRQLRNLIFSKIVPSTINNVPYEGDTITQLIFSTLQATVTVDTTQVDTLTLTSPIKGTLTYSDGTQDSFNGTVTLTVFLDNLFIAPCPSTVTYADGDGATWTNCLNVTQSAFSAPTVVLKSGSDTTQGVLTNFFQDQISAYVASSPNSLGTHTAQNLPQYFAPTLQKFITLTSNPDDVRVLLLVMVNNDSPPTGDQHSAFESSELLAIPAGSDSVIAFDDYTLYDYIALQLGDSKFASLFTSIDVSQDPAVLTAKLKKKNYTGTLQSQIADDEFQSTIKLSNANIVTFSYVTTVTLINNADGTQAFELKNDNTKGNVAVNADNPVVISFIAIYAALAVFSPLHGLIFWTVINIIEYYIAQAFLRFGKALQFDKTKETKGNVEFQGVTLNGGIVLYVNFPQLPGGGSSAVSGTARVVHASLPEPANLDDGISYFIKGIDSMHDA